MYFTYINEKGKKTTYIDVIFDQGRKDPCPGPGEYHYDSEYINSLPNDLKNLRIKRKARRHSRTFNKSPRKTYLEQKLKEKKGIPGPGEYSPEVCTIFKKSAKFAKSSASSLPATPHQPLTPLTYVHVRQRLLLPLPLQLPQCLGILLRVEESSVCIATYQG